MGLTLPTSTLLRADEVIELRLLVAVHESGCGTSRHLPLL
jgi:hypothetical protein